MGDKKEQSLGLWNKNWVLCANPCKLTFYSDQADVKQMLTLVTFCRFTYQSLSLSLSLRGFTRSDRVWTILPSRWRCITKREEKFNSRSLSFFCLSYAFTTILYRFSLSLPILYVFPLSFFLSSFRCNVITFPPICVIDSKHNLPFEMRFLRLFLWEFSQNVVLG